MKIALVVEAKMLPVPESIMVLDNWGFVGVVDSEGGPLAHGEHMHLLGAPYDFIRWLGEYDAVWRTKSGTSPMFQQFEACHVPNEKVAALKFFGG
jgi:hypothetical protein